MKVHYVPEDEYNLPWIAYIVAALVFGACVGYGFGLSNGVERERAHVLNKLMEQYNIQIPEGRGEAAYEFPLPDDFAPTEADLQALLLHISTSTIVIDEQKVLESSQFEMPPARAREPSILEEKSESATSASIFSILKNILNSLQ